MYKHSRVDFHATFSKLYRDRQDEKHEKNPDLKYAAKWLLLLLYSGLVTPWHTSSW